MTEGQQKTACSMGTKCANIIKWKISKEIVRMSDTAYTSPKIAEALRKRFGDKVKPIKVEMKYTQEVASFIRRVDAAHKATAKSVLVFK